MMNLRNTRKIHDEDMELVKNALVRDLCDIWESSNLPFVEEFRVKVRVSELIEEAQSLERSRAYTRYRHDSSWIAKTSATYDVLFDLTKCRCYRYCKSALEIVAPKCKCPPGKKIPDIKQSEKEFTDLEFYADQIFSRALTIDSSIDKRSSQEIQRIEDLHVSKKRRREESEKRLEKARKRLEKA